LKSVGAQQAMCGSVRYRDAEATVPVTCRPASSELHRAISAKLARRNDQQYFVQAVRTHGAPNRRCQNRKLFDCSSFIDAINHVVHSYQSGSTLTLSHYSFFAALVFCFNVLSYVYQ
jgi:hypothetical protein